MIDVQKAEAGRQRGRERGKGTSCDSHKDKEKCSLQTLVTELGYTDLRPPSAVSSNLRLGPDAISETGLDGRLHRQGEGEGKKVRKAGMDSKEAREGYLL